MESYNAIIRSWSVHSNRQAPSRDIAQAAAGIASIRHLLTGGYYKQDDVTWVQAGPSALAFGRTPSIITQRMGLDPHKALTAGHSKFLKNSLEWENTQCAAKDLQNVHYIVHELAQSPHLYSCADIMIANGEKAAINDFVIFDDSIQSQGCLAVGRLKEIISKLSALHQTSEKYILLEIYETRQKVMPYNMPSLNPTSTFRLVRFNVTE